MSARTSRLYAQGGGRSSGSGNERRATGVRTRTSRCHGTFFIVSEDASEVPQNVTALISMRLGFPSLISLA